MFAHGTRVTSAARALSGQLAAPRESHTRVLGEANLTEKLVINALRTMASNSGSCGANRNLIERNSDKVKVTVPRKGTVRLTADVEVPHAATAQATKVPGQVRRKIVIDDMVVVIVGWSVGRNWKEREVGSSN